MTWQPRRRFILKALFMSSLTTVIVIVLAELVLRLLLPNEGYFIWPRNYDQTLEPKASIMPGIAGKATFSVNSAGFRGSDPTPSQDYRILAIGGSTTECLFLDKNETWPHLLQENLADPGTWVGNGGMSGRTSRHHMTAVRYLPLQDLKIDLVLILVGINDLTVRLALGEFYEPNFREQAWMETWLLSDTFIGSNLRGGPGPYYKETMIWRLLRQAKHSFLPSGVKHDAGDFYTKLRLHRAGATDIRSTLPPMGPALEEYEKNLKETIGYARVKGVDLVFMTQPTIWRPDLSDAELALLWLGGIGDFHHRSDCSYYSVAALSQGISLYNETLLRVCREQGVDCFDLASNLEKDTSVFYDDVHFNEMGAEKVAELVTAYLNSRGHLTDRRDGKTVGVDSPR